MIGKTQTGYFVRKTEQGLQIWQDGIWQEWPDEKPAGRCVLFLSSAVITGHVLQEWPKAATLQSETVAYALEDILPRSIRYYTYLFARYGRAVIVDIIEKDTLSELSALCAKYALHSAVAAYHALPIPDSGMVCKQMGDWWLLREKDGWGLCCSGEELLDYLQLMPLPQELPVDGDCQWLASFLPKSCTLKKTTLPLQNPPPRFDCLSALKASKQGAKSLPLSTLSLGFLWFLSAYSLSLYADVYTLKRDMRALEQNMHLAATELFPPGVEISDPFGRVESRHLSMTGGENAVHWRPYFQEIAEQGISVEGLQYDGKSLILQIPSYDDGLLEKIRERKDRNWQKTSDGLRIDLIKERS